MALKREKHTGGSQPAQAQLKVCHGDGYDNIDRAFRISWYKQKSTLAVCHAFWQPTFGTTYCQRIIWILLKSTEDAPLNHIPTWAQKMEYGWYTLFFKIAVSKIEIADSKLKLPRHFWATVVDSPAHRISTLTQRPLSIYEIQISGSEVMKRPWSQTKEINE